MTSDLKQLVAESRQHHSFFLDEAIARQLAQERNFISPESGEPQLQMCFFAGTDSKIIDENLISVSLDELVSFFSENEVPIPTYLLIPPGIGSRERYNGSSRGILVSYKHRQTEPTAGAR